MFMCMYTYIYIYIYYYMFGVGVEGVPTPSTFSNARYYKLSLASLAYVVSSLVYVYVYSLVYIVSLCCIV